MFGHDSYAPAKASATPPKTGTAISMDIELQRQSDVALLSALRVKHICDLMVENKKKKQVVVFWALRVRASVTAVRSVLRRLGVNITSSEKVESVRYADFSIHAIPYPGCEFFRVFRDNNYSGVTAAFVKQR